LLVTILDLTSSSFFESISRRISIQVEEFAAAISIAIRFPIPEAAPVIRIETLFSQLCDQFMIRRNYAKTFEGFKTRILAKITTVTVIQYLNKFVFQRNINNLKINLV
jgi:hypothetical protein